MQPQKLGYFSVAWEPNGTIKCSQFLSQTNFFYKSEQRFTSTDYFNLTDNMHIYSDVNFN